MSSELHTEEGSVENSVEERLERLEKAQQQFHAKQKQVSRNTVVITLVRYALVIFMGGVALTAAVLSGANYERKIGEDSSISFKGADFKGALDLVVGFATGGIGIVGFGERFSNFFKSKDDNE
jgi:hypothetical protein